MSRANVIEYADMSRVTGVSERNVRMVPPGVGGKYQELSGVLAYIVYGHSADSRDSSYHFKKIENVSIPDNVYSVFNGDCGSSA